MCVCAAALFPHLVLPAARTSLTCGSTWTRTARSRRIAASSSPAASLHGPCAPSNCTTGKSMRWEELVIAHVHLLRELSVSFPARVGSWGGDSALCVPQGDSEPRYKCHVCDKCFTRGNNLTVHLRKKHHFKWPSGHPRFRYCSPFISSVPPVQCRAQLELPPALCWLCLGSDVWKCAQEPFPSG